MGRPNNAHTVEVTFLDDDGNPADPEQGTEITWQVLDHLKRELKVETIPIGEATKVDTGVYSYDYVPELGVSGFWVGATVILDGRQRTAWSDFTEVQLPE